MYFDIGANVGKWSLANIDTCDKIIAVEASPYTFEELTENCIHDNITLINYAVCNNNCNDVTFYQAYWDTLSTLNKDWLTESYSRFCNHPYAEIKCRSITLDVMIEQYGKPDFIKIDVEGGEYECITSLTQKVDLLCFEWAAELHTVTYNCLDYLHNLGFTQFYIQNGDDYTFRPSANDYYNLITIKLKLALTEPKKDWGMIWCK